jgi:hypothetical protein
VDDRWFSVDELLEASLQESDREMKMFLMQRTMSRVAGAGGRRLLEAVLEEPPLVPLLDKLEMQGGHVVLQLGDGGLEDADVGDQLLGLRTEARHGAARRPPPLGMNE